jgi:hypothetical protein
MSNNTTGHDNQALGVSALAANTTGFANAAIGNDALPSNTTGFINVGIGYGALGSNIDGFANIAIGNNAGYNPSVPLQHMNESIFIGAAANSSVDGVTNSTAIGYNAQVTASNQIVIGNGSVVQTLINGSGNSSRPLPGIGQKGWGRDASTVAGNSVTEIG